MKRGIVLDGVLRRGMSGVHHYCNSLANELSLVWAGEGHAYVPGMSTLKEVALAQQHPAALWWNNGLQVDTAGRVPSGAHGVLHPVEHARLRRRFSRRDARVRETSASYDLLHVTLPQPYLEELVPRRTVFTLYDTSVYRYPDYFPRAAVAEWRAYTMLAKQRADLVVTLSESVKDELCGELGFERERVVVTPLAARFSDSTVPLEQQHRELRQLDLLGRRFVLYAGSIERRKGVLELVRGFAATAERHPDVPLVLAGGVWHQLSDDFEQALGVARAAGAEVRVLGYVSEQLLVSLMSACTAFVYLSEYEGFGLPPLEAMSCGAPVITTGSSSLPEVVGEAGVLIDRRPEAVADALDALLDDPPREARLRAASRARAAGFSWVRTAAVTHAAHERLLH